MKILEEKSIKLGKLLKAEREKRGWSLQSVIIKLNEEISKTELSALENGKRKIINPILLKRLCKIYELDTEEIFRSIDYLDNDDIKQKNDLNNDENLVSIKIFKNIEDAGNFPSIEIKEVCSTSIPLKINSSSNLVGALIEGNGEDIPNEFIRTEWIVISKDTEILNGEIGVFLYNGEYMIKKKIISTTSKIILIGNNNSAILVEKKDRLKEIGKVVWTFSKERN